jgi:hypothetical protein
VLRTGAKVSVVGDDSDGLGGDNARMAYGATQTVRTAAVVTIRSNAAGQAISAPPISATTCTAARQQAADGTSLTLRRHFTLRIDRNG